MNIYVRLDLFAMLADVSLSFAYQLVNHKELKAIRMNRPHRTQRQPYVLVDRDTLYRWISMWNKRTRRTLDSQDYLEDPMLPTTILRDAFGFHQSHQDRFFDPPENTDPSKAPGFISLFRRDFHYPEG